MCVCVSLGAGVLADPAFNSCRDPGTPAYGIPIMAQGFQVGNNSRPHVFNGKAAKWKQEQNRMSPGTNNKSTWNVRKRPQVRIEGLDNSDSHFKSNRQSFPPMLETTSSAAQRNTYSCWPAVLDKIEKATQVYFYSTIQTRGDSYYFARYNIKTDRLKQSKEIYNKIFIKTTIRE